MWDKLEINLGDILENSVHKLKFTHLEPLKIVEMIASCGCTTPVYDIKTGDVNVTYKAGKVPKHLRYKGSFITFKEVKVYTEDQIYTLTIRATIKMKHFYDR